jgi:orotidine-5'-phosphate decarboxylase
MLDSADFVKPSDTIYCALDTADPAAARAMAKRLAGLIGGVKLGLEFFSANGPAGVARIARLGLPVFLDLKLHDIPNTVARAVSALMTLEPAILTLHGSGGADMLRAAAEAAHETAEKLGVKKPRLAAVTVLTSLSQSDLEDMGIAEPMPDRVLRMATLAQECGLDAAVCSAAEVAALRNACGKAFTLIVPGVRPEWAEPGDQKRITTPREARALGADILVIGRPITAAKNPREAAQRIGEELEIA